MGTKPLTTQSGIRRFPRLTTGTQAAGSAQLLWTQPELQILFRQNPPATQFIFTVSVSRGFRTQYGNLYQMIFKRFDWPRALDRAYREGKYGSKSVAEYIALGLRKTFIDALAIWLGTPAKWGTEYEEFTSRALSEFAIASRRKTGPQPNPLDAMLAAKRFNDLVPRLTKLRRALRSRARVAREEELIKAVAKVVPWGTASEALRHILGEQASIKARQFFLSSKVSNQQIAREIVHLELVQRGCNLNSISLRKYLRSGEEILKMLSDLPDVRSTARPPNR